MATDVEESDTEDHERPAPPKRQCVNFLSEDDEQSAHQPVQDSSSTEDSELLTREKFQRYHQYQIDKHCYMGSVDNTINRVMETYILTPLTERIQLRLSTGESEMEDHAVMMAIRNHGLVHSSVNNFSSHSNTNSSNAYWYSDDEYNSSLSPINCMSNITTTVAGAAAVVEQLSSESSDSNSASATSSTKIIQPRTFQSFDDKIIKHNNIRSNNNVNWSADKNDDGDQQSQDILERAVSEAIKIKGLSVLSVDYV
ncbi:GSCOCG00001897001-RA-CDS [Cotesia congregata]|uniref:Uncharacterized protein n=1 Tax=Cotesia congregata TaxID=51543 RepID=A0A8J2HR98_COTCN|nr:GSCOCG00001897001-RA-CDS [Cotesia congregata]CAG5108822.1 Protein of unknown function [Cotesia congregata]